jgi:hypothetical protein
VSLALITNVLRIRNGARRKAIQEQELKEHEQKLSLVLNVKSENLDALKCGGWGYL